MDQNIEIVGPYGPHVKVVCKPAACPSVDLVVKVRDITQPDGWRTSGVFNDMADDLAYANAHARAMAERRKLFEREGL